MQPLGPMELKDLCIAAGYPDQASPVPVIVEAYDALAEKETLTADEQKLMFELSFRLMLSDYHGKSGAAATTYTDLVTAHGVETFRPAPPPEPDPAE